jgi:hypothetical protein
MRLERPLTRLRRYPRTGSHNARGVWIRGGWEPANGFRVGHAIALSRW